MIDKKEIGKRIKQIRKSLGLKQEEFVRNLNISTTSISEIETGKFNPNIELLANMAKVYNVNLYYVMFNEGDMFIDAALSFHQNKKKYAVDVEDVRDFFYYFERSSIFQYEVMKFFKTKLLREKEIFQEEIDSEQEK